MLSTEDFLGLICFQKPSGHTFSGTRIKRCLDSSIISLDVPLVEVHLVICEGRHFTHVRKKHLHDHIISLRVNAWAHITSLIPPLFIVVPYFDGTVREFVYVLMLTFLPLFPRFCHWILQLF